MKSPRLTPTLLGLSLLSCSPQDAEGERSGGFDSAIPETEYPGRVRQIVDESRSFDRAHMETYVSFSCEEDGECSLQITDSSDPMPDGLPDGFIIQKSIVRAERDQFNALLLKYCPNSDVVAPIDRVLKGEVDSVDLNCQ